MTTAQVVDTSVTVNNNSPIQDYVHRDDQTQPTFEMTPGFKPFTVFNYFLAQGTVPDVLKTSKVHPYQQGAISVILLSPDLCSMSVYSNFWETCVSTLNNYIEKNNILKKFQFGLRKGMSTEQAIAEITDNLKKQ